MRRLLDGWEMELQGYKHQRLQRIVILETNDAGDAFQR